MVSEERPHGQGYGSRLAGKVRTTHCVAGTFRRPRALFGRSELPKSPAYARLKSADPSAWSALDPVTVRVDPLGPHGPGPWQRQIKNENRLLLAAASAHRDDTVVATKIEPGDLHRWFDDLRASGIEAVIGASPAGRLQPTLRTKVVDELPDQVFEPLRFKVLER